MGELAEKLRRWSVNAEFESVPEESAADASGQKGSVASSGLTFETQPTQSRADAAAGARVAAPAKGPPPEFDFARLLQRAQTSSGSTTPADAQKVRSSVVCRIRKRYFELVELGVAANDAAARAIVEVGGQEPLPERPCSIEASGDEAHASESENETIEAH